MCVGVDVGVVCRVSCDVCARVRVRACACVCVCVRVCGMLARSVYVYGPLWGGCVRGFLARELRVSWLLWKFNIGGPMIIII